MQTRFLLRQRLYRSRRTFDAVQIPPPIIIVRCTTTTNKKTTPSPPPSSITPSLLSSYAQLAKAKLSALVVTTTAAGYIAAGGGGDVLTGCSVVAGTFLCSASAAAANQLYERHQDAQMQRTRQRPTVTGHISPHAGMIASSAWGIGGVGLLYSTCGELTAGLGALNIVLYAGIYTPLKQHTIYNTWVGAIVGAIPPIMGCTAAAAAADPHSLFHWGTASSLALTLYYWQLVHFLALSHMYRVDYERGGFVMLGGVDTPQTAASMVRNAYGLALVPPALAYMTGATSGMYVVESVVLNTYTLYLCHQFQDDSSNQKARRVFMNSLWYLPCTLILFCWHSRGLLDKDTTLKEEEQHGLLQSLRELGRRHCIHEQHAVHETCPVTHDAPLAVVETTQEVVTVTKETVKDVSSPTP